MKIQEREMGDCNFAIDKGGLLSAILVWLMDATRSMDETSAWPGCVRVCVCVCVYERDILFGEPTPFQVPKLLSR